MKLKLILLAIIVNILFSLPFVEQWGGVKAQTWCPVGATWYYGHNSFSATQYYKVEYDSDTLINSISCKKIKKTIYSYYHSAAVFDTVYLADEYTYSDSDKVYLYRFNNFYTLYDFSANVGDIWQVAGTNKYSFASCDSVGFVKVDSLGTMPINGQLLRYLCVSPVVNSKWGWSGKIAEKIGPIVNYPIGLGTFNYLFPNKLDYCGMNLEEVTEGSYLRCYSDSTFGLYSTGISPSCDYFATNIVETNFKSLFSIYPNPASDEFNIVFKDATATEAIIEIHDLLGKLIERVPLKSGVANNYNTQSLQKSIYLVSLYINGKLVDNQKLVLMK